MTAHWSATSRTWTQATSLSGRVPDRPGAGHLSVRGRRGRVDGGRRNAERDDATPPAGDPTYSFGRPETPIHRLYLASSSVHPGGGVHGGPGANAARAALLWDRVDRAAAPARL